MTAPIDNLPRHLDAEQALLGILLYTPAALNQVDGVEARHFSEPFHGLLFETLKERLGKGLSADPMLMGDKFAGNPAFEELGGVRYLADMVDHAPPATAVTEYALAVFEMANRRSLIHLAHDLTHAARDLAADVGQTIVGAEKQITQLARGAEPGEANMVDARDAAEEMLEEFEREAEHGKPKGMMTGLRCIDRRLKGLRPGHLIIMAGRPSMGKSGLMRQAAFGAADRNPRHQFPIFCAEMARREMSERTLSELSYRAGEGIAYQDMSGEKLTPMERIRLRELIWKVPKNLILDDTPVLSLEYVRRRIWALKRKGPVGAAFIDYLQIMERPPNNGRNDAAMIGDLTSGLKRLAREAEMAIVLLSQISRAVESRDDKRPQLSDLRESGSIEQDANSVLFPFREVYYVERAEPKEGSKEHAAWEDSVEILKRRMDVICAKNRGGAVGTDIQEYFAEYDAISDTREGR